MMKEMLKLKWPILMISILMSCSCSSVQGEINMKYTAPHNGKTFDNIEPFPDKGFLDILKWRFNGKREDWPKEVELKHNATPKAHLGESEVKYTVIGHASILIQIGGINIITDPHYSKRSSPVSWAGPARVTRPAIKFEDLPPIDIVMVSHNHYDHLDLDTLIKLNKRDNPLVLIGAKNGPLLKENGISHFKEMDWWEKVETKGLSIHFVPAQHWSARGLFDRFETLWGGFFVSFKKGDELKKIYFAGDTGYGKFFSMIKERLGSPDLAFLPIGAYEPRWFMKNAHMNPEDAVNAHFDLGSNMSVGIHFETFQLTDEGFGDPRRQTDKLTKEKEISRNFLVPEFGIEYGL